MLNEPATDRRILAIAGSARTSSANQTLAGLVVSDLIARDRVATMIDLADYEMPLYNGDLEERDGVPDAAHRLKEAFDSADGLIVASPEYNGAMTPLLKNSIDWVSRLDLDVLRGKLVGLMATTPGRRGGVHGLGIVRQWFDYLGLDVAANDFALPSYNHMIEMSGATISLKPEGQAALTAFVDSYLAEYDDRPTEPS